MPRAGNRRKKTRTHQDNEAAIEEVLESPKSFIMKRGKVGIFIRELV